MRITPHLRARIRAHAGRWVALPELIVPSAAVDDAQTKAWSEQSYEADMDEDRKHRTHRACALVALGGMLVAATLLGSGVARADDLDDYIAVNGPIVCEILDSYPTVAGVEGVGLGL